ncbi:hypothetical protein COCSADRAFT_349151 [Bipolaris sorokiniana ND90Pr]|uniref:Uncharacterized protein n=1 Tax=Cochliobolus sativus (strain ND90Pr / ATCC 201652) TaxID=665912 RepID=M2TGN5_COCSN|nr:uncharacterized protein COCSADRAFT_349151 [Bipolaris sorokiniana ND90Pr]EMD67887.1 hypothetical protein COCSADRAFT_349151 [Bipolaris sorokiniana ND90Pr]
MNTISSRQSFQLRPLGWEHDPAEERFKLSTIDHTLNCAYTHYAIFFRLEDARKTDAVDVLRAGLERTLSQARHMCGTIEPDPEGGLSFVKRRDSTVQFVVHWLDPLGQHPSLDDIEKAHFSGRDGLRDINLWSIPELTWGERPEAEPDRSPVVSAYQITLTKGGLVLSMHHHHYSCDVMGWNAFTRQLSANCYAIANSSSFPLWDPACLDVSRFTKDVPKDSLVEGPPVAQKHAGHLEQQSVLFHLPKSKAAALKELAKPAGSMSPWISTYDAVCAYIWRMLSSIRAPRYKTDPSTILWVGEAVNMRPHLSDPLPERTVRNVVAGAFSDMAPIPPLTAGEVISDAPLSTLAVYIRRLTESCNEARFLSLINAIAPIRNKRALAHSPDTRPPMSMFVSDHRSADVSNFDFGFAKPITYRHLWGDAKSAGVVVIYAPVSSSANPDEGWMFTLTMEKELVPKLIETPEWAKYFEYRGID